MIRLFRRRDHEWRPFNTLRRRLLVDGSRDYGPMMRRRVNGVDQYRRMTDDERAQWEGAWAI